jgi:nicotinamide mononucleotide adenylyltransferase
MAVHDTNGTLPDEETHDDPSPALPADPASYSFPDHRLKTVMDDPSKTPLVLIACGSFSPITYLHLRMFEMAADYVKFSTNFELVGAYLSPVSDAYKKAGLAAAHHR